MPGIAVLLILSVSAILSVTALTSIWIMRQTSQPYKTELYTAEFVKGGWRYLWCADHIHHEDAVVLCKEMSEYNGLGPYDVASARVEFGALHTDRAELTAFTSETFACEGHESRLSDCPMVPVAQRCPSRNVGQVDCNPADNAMKNLTTTLISLPHMAEMGVVKLENSSVRGLTGLVCDEDGLWGQDEANVVCKSLGHDIGFPMDALVVSDTSSLPQSYLIKNVKCQGTEASINDCPHTDMCQAVDFLDKTFRCPDSCDGDIAAVICG